MGIYRSIQGVLESHASYNILLAGIGESVTPLILSSMLAALVLLVHYTVRSLIGCWGVPISN